MPTLEQPLALRLAAANELLGRIRPVPNAWLSESPRRPSSGGDRLEPIECTSYEEVLDAWKKALRWRPDIEDVLSTMLSVALSTEQIGDQLFLMVLATAGSAKTRLCDAMLVSRRCHALEHLTGFHSGFKGPDGEDYSLISRINRKTLITPEGDVLMSSPKFMEIMSQQRRIFDGTSGATYKNSKEDTVWAGLRTPWIIAGTPSMMDVNQASLGDRFLKVFLDAPEDEEKAEILKQVSRAALQAVRIKADHSPDKQLSPEMCHAYRVTGGYVDYLREHGPDLLAEVDCSDAFLYQAQRLAEFTADLRARPDPDPKKETVPTKELATRLSHQLVRLACCQTIVTNRSAVDREMMRRTKKVAVDTARGHSLQMARQLFKAHDGLEPKVLANLTGRAEDKTRIMLRFMRHIQICEPNQASSTTGARLQANKWVLTHRMRQLMKDVEAVGK